MTDGAEGGMIAALTPDGRPVSINEKLADSYVARGFTITDEAAAKRIARAHAAVKPGPVTLAPGQIAARAPDGRRVAINVKLAHEYEQRGFTFEGSLPVEPDRAGRPPDPARVELDSKGRAVTIPGEVAMVTPDGRTVNVSAKFAGRYLERGYTMGEQPDRPAAELDDVLPDPMQPGQGPSSAGGNKAGTSY